MEVINRKAVGITGKLWRKVTLEEISEWGKLFDSGCTFREIARMYNRDHSLISRHLAPPEEQIRRNAKRAIAKGYRAGRKKITDLRTLMRRKLVACLVLARKRAEDKGLGIDIDISYLMEMYDKQAGKCSLTDISFVFYVSNEDSRTHPFSPSVDRIDSRKGYTKDNVRLVIWGINLAMGEWGETIYRKIATAYLSDKSEDFNGV